MNFTYRQLDNFRKTISIILKSASLTWEERKQFNKSKKEIDNLLLLQDGLIAEINEMFQYMSSLDVYKEPSKAKELLSSIQTDSKPIFEKEILFEANIFDFNNGFKEDKEKASSLVNLALTLDEVIINYLEPK